MPHIERCAWCGRRWDQSIAVIERLEQRPSESVLPGEVAYSAVLTPVGLFWIAAGDEGVVAVDSGGDEPAFVLEVERRGGRAVRYAPERLCEVVAQFLQYFCGSRRVFDLAIDLRGLSVTQRCVLEAVGQVPWGEVRSYGAIARDIGKPRAARMVGTAIANSPCSIVVPCHRIIRSDGTLGEYARTMRSCGAEIKRWLLAREGVTLEGGRA
jgi:methylated-DNA-[protein]-cysteine S-methyltransferase